MSSSTMPLGPPKEHESASLPGKVSAAQRITSSGVAPAKRAASAAASVKRGLMGAACTAMWDLWDDVELIAQHTLLHSKSKADRLGRQCFGSIAQTGCLVWTDPSRDPQCSGIAVTDLYSIKLIDKGKY